jgi:hypothetical protein
MTPKNQLLFDLFTTALEGGIGYWSECDDYKWEAAVNDRRELVAADAYHAKIREIDYDADRETPYTINHEVMRVGFSRATTPPWRDRIGWSSGEKPPLVVTDDTDWDFDAGDADCIVQLGLFNDVRYG